MTKVHDLLFPSLSAHDKKEVMHQCPSSEQTALVLHHPQIHQYQDQKKAVH